VPRSGPRRKPITIRLSEVGLERLNQRATEEAAGNQSEMVRRMLKYAMQHMPKGWH
jgi:hypothetical protein